MNKNTKYWAAGIAGAVILIIIIAAFAAGSGRNRNDGGPAENSTASESAVESESSSDASGQTGSESMDHGSHTMGSEKASDDDNINRYLHKQDEIMMDMMQAMESIPKSGNASIDFLRGMIPHHESAVDMAESYLEYGGDSGAMKELAENIISTQTDEIKQMQDLITKYENEGHTDSDQESAYLEEYDKMMDHDHQMPKSGTDSLDHAFAEGMVMHHQMAVDMAKSILEYTDYEEIRNLARTMIDTQEKEIEEMQKYIP